MSQPTVVAVPGPRNITITDIEQEIKKSPLQVLTSPKSYSGQSNIVIEGFDFRQLNKTDQKQCAVTDCQNVTVRRCIFGNKSTLGQGLNITGAKTKNVIVEYCIFDNMTFIESNGGEPLRLGNSQFSGITFNCIVRKCIFRGLRSDPETISIKSCGNIIEDNFFIDNVSNVTVRHGGLTTVRHNHFKGKTGGVRIHGFGNTVASNCFEGNTEDSGGSLAPVVIRYGSQDKDPNWTSQSTPSQREGGSHAVYAQAVNTVVENNEFKNCKVTIIELPKGASIAPKNTTKTNNKTVEKFSFETEVVVIPPPTPPPTPTPTPTPTEPVDCKCLCHTTGAIPLPHNFPTPSPTPPAPPATTPPPTPPAESSAVDKFGIKKVYPDATDTTRAQVWYMDETNPSNDPRFKNEQNANLKKESDGGWSSDGSSNGKYQVRLEAWSESGTKKYLNCETTIYAQFMNDVAIGAPGAEPGAYAFQVYRGGGHHSSMTPCEGAAYKARVRKDKSVVIVKEVLHPDYTSNRGGIKPLSKNPLGNYIGTKLVVYNLAPTATSGGRTPVKIEVYCDETGMTPDGKLDPTKQNWVKMAETIDDGRWVSGTGGGCPAIELGNTGKRRPDEIFNQSGGTSAGNLCAYRTDGVKSKIKHYSVREIKPPQQ